jgi:4-hydroxybenzoate polyprenyltransferase
MFMGDVAGYVRMLRVEDWIFGYFFIPLIGTFAAAGISPVLWTTAAVSACILAFGFVINNVADVEIDRLHTAKCVANKNPLTSRSVSVGGSLVLLIVLALIPLVLSLMSSVPAFVIVTVTLILWGIYSVFPFRLKERYLLDLATHGIMAGPLLFLVGYTLAVPVVPLLSVKVLSLLGLFTCIGCMALLVHQIGDFEEDRGNSATTVVRIGKKKGWFLLLAFFILSIAFLAAVNTILILDLWILVGSIALFAIPLSHLRSEIHQDFFSGPLQADKE